MTFFARTLKAHPRERSTKRTLQFGLAPVAALLAVLALAPVASAEIAEVEGTTVGLQPRNAAELRQGEKLIEFANPEGHKVLAKPDTYVIFWDPWDRYHPEWQRLVNAFMQNVGSEDRSTASVFAVDTQYTDAAGEHAAYESTFHGAYTDTHAYPVAGCSAPVALEKYNRTTCLTDAQIRAELEGFVPSHGLPKGTGAIYYLLTPPGVTVCLDAAGAHCSEYTRPKARTVFKFAGEEAGEETLIPTEIFQRETLSSQASPQENKTFREEAPQANDHYKTSFCSYHSAINPGGSPEGSPEAIIYAAIPWIAGSAGNTLLAPEERTWAYECQDGGFNETSKFVERETPKKETAEEAVKFEEKLSEANPGEKLALIEAKERETPHIQEPEQSGRGEAGTYDSGLADLIVNQVAVEQQNIVTDPLLASWRDGKLEATDECRNDFATSALTGTVGAQAETQAGTLYNQALGSAHYYLNDAFNLASATLTGYGWPCVSGVNLIPRFTSPNPVLSGERVGFDGMESNITLNIGTRYEAGKPAPTYAYYEWTFAPASPIAGVSVETVKGYAPGAPACEAPWATECAASIFHTFPKPGLYNVTLKAEDVGGNEAGITHQVDVVAVKHEAETTGPNHETHHESGTEPSAGSPSTGGSQGSGKAPKPVASAQLVSRSLGDALENGVAVRYEVNEEVTGHMDVLLSAKLAHKLGLRGRAATELPAGTEPMIVLASRVVHTVKKGHSTLHLNLQKSVIARLRKLPRVSLELRLVVRNGLNVEPGTSTSLVTLGPPPHKHGKHLAR